MTMSGSTCLASLRTQREKNQSWLACWRVSRRAKRGQARVSAEARKAGARVSPAMFRELERVVVLRTTNKFDGSLQSDRLNRGWKDQPAHGTNKGRGRSQLAQMDDILARTRCFKSGELGHLAKECPQNKETTTNSETFFSGMVYINSCNVHPQNRFWADRCRDNSCAGAFRSNCTGCSQDDSAGVSRGDSAGASHQEKWVKAVVRIVTRVWKSLFLACLSSMTEGLSWWTWINQGECASADFF